MLDYLRRASVPTDLLGIIAEVRRRWRLKLALRGIVRVLAVLMAFFIVAALLMQWDRFSPLSILVARVALAATLATSVYWFLFRPLRKQVTDEQVVAANVDPAESHTAPLPLESLEALGVVLAKPGIDAATLAAATQASERLLKVAEIEQRQRWWVWILAAVLVLLVIETVIAARISLAARTVTDPIATSSAPSASGATP